MPALISSPSITPTPVPVQIFPYSAPPTRSSKSAQYRESCAKGGRKGKRKGKILNAIPSRSARVSKETGKREGSSSRFPGVCWHKGQKRWVAQIRVDGKNIRVGSFDNEQDAADAYQKAKKRVNRES